MNIILLCGFSGSGKDYVGGTICKYHGYKRFAFADSLKKLLSEKYDIPIEDFHCQATKASICESDPQKRTLRKLMIDEALTYRAVDDNIFAKYCAKDILESGYTNIVITDWRFINEEQTIRQMFPNANIYKVRVLRLNQDKSYVDDKSEYGLLDIQMFYVILNPMNHQINGHIEFLMNTIHSKTNNSKSNK